MRMLDSSPFNGQTNKLPWRFYQNLKRKKKRKELDKDREKAKEWEIAIDRK